ncbi:hypothetical protein F0562_008662 [Nyssa sinensis]|uniref:BSD domain-containing protein n=1 Tax=Nyssa sinensis TaxID=561372 RepID=A0A5J5AA01_9ASTE|nr:hypothetical protein F0562_008662 [Nyssa sinensis]
MLCLVPLRTARVLTMSGESGKAGSERSAVTVQDEQLSTAEIKRRIKLLQEDSELQKLHMQFVIGSVLTEAEFWATRKMSDHHLMEIKESVHLDFRHQVSLLVQPMLQVLDAAFAHYDADLEERSAKSREIPNGFGEEKAGAAS